MIIIEEIKGLSREEVIASREKNGENRLKAGKRKTFIKSFFSNLNDPIIRVLIIALFVNIIVMLPNINWFEIGGICASIIISTLVSTISEHGQENAFERLRQENENKTVIVKRAEGVFEIPSEELVVGDIMLLSQGEGIYADAQLLTGSLLVDESALTGESKEIKKSAGKGGALYKGSLISSGNAEARVTGVGENTYYGRVAKELKSNTRPSPLKLRLTKLAKSISILGYICAILIALAYLFNTFVIDQGFNWALVLLKLQDTRFLISKLISALTLGISVVVVAVPEGLPMMITVVLSSNMQKMSKDNVLVRRLVGIETSGNINLLFTDKTGTLTEGRLKVKSIYTPDGSELRSLNTISTMPELKKYLTLCGLFCNSATMSGGKAVGSDPTDRAILEYLSKERLNAQVQEKIPFDSVKKYSTATLSFDGESVSVFKGAPEKLISASCSYLDKNGSTCQMDKEKQSKIRAKLKELADKSYRVVALAYKKERDMGLYGLTFLCLVAIRDRIRKEVPEAINSVTRAGVGVVMITGDNKDTAVSIAKECGIISSLTKRNLAITGAELEALSDKELGDMLPSLAVIARALPQDKSRLVRVAQERGLVVGMTGDGINDAASLKAADVGFGMGSGTEVAKEASDIVIKDNNFASIVKAILYGRTIFESIRKFIVFQLTMNLGAVGISLIGPFIGIDKPVTITQMLWVNIIMDTLGALAFASEPPLLSYMKQKPKKREESIINKPMLRSIIFSGLYFLGISIWFLKSDTLPCILTRADEKYLLSAFFAMFIFTGVFVCFTSRSQGLNILSYITKNKSFITIMVLISVLQMAFIYFGGDVFRTTPLDFVDLLIILAISFSIVIFDFLRKLIERYIMLNKKAYLLKKRKNEMEEK
ncbi:MAG: calcium-translocating P-type ATPase, PMCA-type [Clostridia bacterium]|nr:calcium-translocating P-type ATPase, PMCA-type [Clostridia bacterium]